jgi:hypothetical protein
MEIKDKYGRELEIILYNNQLSLRTCDEDGFSGVYFDMSNDSDRAKVLALIGKLNEIVVSSLNGQNFVK